MSPEQRLNEHQQLIRVIERKAKYITKLNKGTIKEIEQEELQYLIMLQSVQAKEYFNA